MSPNHSMITDQRQSNTVTEHNLLQLLLGPETVGVPAGLLPAVGGPGVQPGVALPADDLVTVVLLGQDPQGGLYHSSPQSEHQVEGGLLLDVVVRQSPAILQLLASKDQPLLIRRNSFLVLDLGLDILDGVTGLDLKGDGLTREGLDEDLHFYLSCRSESSNISLV